MTGNEPESGGRGAEASGIGNSIPGPLGEYPGVVAIWGTALVVGIVAMLLLVSDRSLLLVFIPVLVVGNLMTGWAFARFFRD